MDMIDLKNICKAFNNKKILDGIDITVNQGECLCLIGPNGAGKSTILNIILGLLTPDYGELQIMGETYYDKSNTIKGKIGCMPEKTLLIEDLSGYDFLMLHGLLLCMKKIDLKNKIDDLISLFFDDKSLIDNMISTYSTGNKKRLEFCAALLNSPSILILDEPFNGLDPVFVDKLIRVFKLMMLKQKTLIISSHDLSYIKELATDVALISHGKIIIKEKKDNFYAQGETVLENFFKYLPKEHIRPDEVLLPNWI